MGARYGDAAIPGSNVGDIGNGIIRVCLVDSTSKKPESRLMPIKGGGGLIHAGLSQLLSIRAAINPRYISQPNLSRNGGAKNSIEL